MGRNCAAGKLAGSNSLLEFSVFIGGQLWANKLHSWEWFIHAISGTIGDGLSLGFAPWIGIGYPKTGDAVAPSSPSQQDHPNLGEHEKRTIETTQLFKFHHVSSNNHQGFRNLPILDTLLTKMAEFQLCYGGRISCNCYIDMVNYPPPRISKSPTRQTEFPDFETYNPKA